ncbi:MAG: type II secretion system protein [Verrucomicrobiales bacterium]|nr:type II secretion system protein [Verrucomicrobiales bacterium]
MQICHPVPARSAGFSLLEIIVALAVAMLILGGAVLTITPVNDEHQIRRTGGKIETTARKALIEAGTENRTALIVVGRDCLEDETSGAEWHWPEDIRILIRPPGNEKWQVPSAGGYPWRFFPQGICEPLAFRIESEAAEMEFKIDPLTGEAREERVIVNAQ